MKAPVAIPLPTPPTAKAAAAQFQNSDHVRTIPDTTPGAHPSHSEAVYGHVVHVEPRADAYWHEPRWSRTVCVVYFWARYPKINHA